MIATHPGEWVTQGACVPGGEHTSDGVTPARARQLCAPCPVRIECGKYALETEQPFWIWGGMTPRERTRLKNLMKQNNQQTGD